MSALEPFLACSASAGSGKTWQLSIRYLALLFNGASADEILTLTFTKKATAEMLERIVNLLLNIENGGQSSELDELSRLLQVDKSEILRQAPAIRKKFLQSPHNIMTIDAFFNRVLKLFSLNIGFSPFYDIRSIDNAETIENFLLKVYSNGVSNDLIYIAYLLRGSISDIFDLLALIYNNKIAINSDEKSDIDPIQIRDIEMSIFDCFLKIKLFIEQCENASDSALKAVKLDGLDSVIEQTWFRKNSLSEYNYFKKCFKPEIDDVFFELKEKICGLYALKEESIINALFKIYKLYETTLLEDRKKRKAFNYNDITHLTYELLTKKIDKDFFYFKLDSKIKHILIDEFQDTSIVQFNIIRPLIEELISGEGTRSKTGIKSFFYVGDEKQSIYRFRGGNPYLFNIIKDLYKNISVQELDTNFRSCRNIVNFVNEVFKIQYNNYLIQKSSKNDDGYIEVLETDDLINSVIATVDKLIGSGIEQNKIAILTFTNKDVAKCVDLIKMDRPDLLVSTETSEKIINLPVVRSIIEAVKYIYFKNPLYKENFIALNSFSKSDVDLDCFDCYIDKPPYILVFNIIKKFGLFTDNQIEIIDLLEWVSVLNNIEEFIFGYNEFNREIENRIDNGISVMTIHKSKGLEFDYIVLFDRITNKKNHKDNLIFDLDGVNFRNIVYRFKGREFVDSSFKTILDNQEKDRERDELNLLYVAFTRAKNGLFIIKKDKNSSFEKLNIYPMVNGIFPKQVLEHKNKSVIKIEKYAFEPTLGAQEIVEVVDDKEKDFDAINFGLALHYMIEILGKFDENNIEIAAKATYNRFGKLVDILDVKMRIVKLIKSEHFLGLIANKKIYKEHSIVMDNRLIRLDLIAEGDNDINIIDFKSGSFNENHVTQVKNYLEILSKVTQKKLRGYLVYLSSNVVVKEVA